MNGLKSNRGNYSIRMCRRNRIVEWLCDQLEEGSKSSRIKVDELRSMILSEDDSLSMKECGIILRKAFPKTERRKLHSSWYYFGVNYKNANLNEKNVVATQEEEVNGNISRNLKEHAIPAGLDQLQQRGLLFKIPSLNISVEAMTPIHECSLIGEGTFGMCMAGKYQNLPVAIKVFKSIESPETIHHEANIQLKIPSHPNIAMLIGVQTVEQPYLLLSRLCLNHGKPQTYFNYLQEFRDCEAVNLMVLKGCIKLLLDTASALNHIHMQGIIHNDLKGNNVVIESIGEVKHAILIDFGKAKTITDAKRSQPKLLTEQEQLSYRTRFPHIAPEIAKGGLQSYISDIFSYGYLYCSTLKVFRKSLQKTKEKDVLLRLGKNLTSPNTQKRDSLEVILSTLRSIKL